MSSKGVVFVDRERLQKELKEILKKQSYLKSLLEEIKKTCIINEENKILFNGNTLIEGHNRDIKKSLSPIIINLKGDIEYSEYEEKIVQKRNLIESLIEKCNNILLDYYHKKENYEAYKEFIEQYNKLKDFFEKYQKELVENVHNNFLNNNEKKVNDFIQKVKDVKIDSINVKNIWNFKEEFKNYDVQKYFLEKENEIQKFEENFYKDILNNSNKISFKREIKYSKEVEEIIKKIKLLISKCDDEKLMSNYQNRLDNIMKSNAFNDVYFYQELYEDIFEKEKSRRIKKELTKLIVKLNTIEFDPYLQTQKNNALQNLSKIIEKDKINEREKEIITSQIENLIEKNKKLTEEKKIKEEEEKFVKTQIINHLEELGYEVMEDLTVLDFEKENIFYLKLPSSKNNYVKIQFNKDGTFNFQFYTTHSKESLTTEQEEIIMNEMQNMCKDFEDIKKDFEKIGIDMKTLSLDPPAISNIETIPEEIREKVVNKKQEFHKNSIKQVKRMYLD